MSTTNNRPILNTRDEPIASEEQFMRLHVICGDANMSQFTNYLKVGITTLFLAMMEQQQITNYELYNPVKELCAVNRDVTGKNHRLETMHRGKITALDMQLRYRDLMGKFLYHGTMNDFRPVFEAYSAALEEMKNTDAVLMSEHFDHALKYSLLEKLVLRKGKTLEEEDAKIVDVSYHRISPPGLFFVGSNCHKTVVEEQDIMKFYGENATTPETRARDRMMLVKGLEARGLQYSIDWNGISFGAGRTFPDLFYHSERVGAHQIRFPFVRLDDPRMVHSDNIQLLFYRLDRLGYLPR